MVKFAKHVLLRGSHRDRADDPAKKHAQSNNKYYNNS